jgi:small subunit ribosomal protein S20
MVKTQIKRFEEALDAGDQTKAQEMYRLLTKKLDTVAATSTMHKNTASRVKSRMARRLNAAAK